MEVEEFEGLSDADKQAEVKRMLDELAAEARNDPEMAEMLKEADELIKGKLTCACCRHNDVHTSLPVDPVIFVALTQLMEEYPDDDLGMCWVCEEHAENNPCLLITGTIYRGEGYAALSVINPISAILGQVMPEMERTAGVINFGVN